MTSLSLEQVSKTYRNGHQAVHDVSFVAAPGERIVLVGPSGCGKTTILRLIAGLERISSGTIHFGDELYNDVPPGERDVAMVFQNHAVYPHMRVIDNLRFGLRLRRRPAVEIDARVRQVANLLGIESVLHRWPSELSGGQQQRVAIGRAIVREPRLFLFDEPLSNLDPQLRSQMRIDLVELQQSLGTTTIYVTHDQMEAMTMAHRVVVLRNGQVQQVDTPADLYRHPSNVFVAGFIGSPGMNLVKGRIEEGHFRPTEEGRPLALPDRVLGWFDLSEKEEVILGIRAESIRPSDDSTRLGDLEVEGSVEAVESIGSDAYLHLRWGNTRLTQRIRPGTAVIPGAPVRVKLDPAAVHIFAVDTGKSLRE